MYRYFTMLILALAISSCSEDSVELPAGTNHKIVEFNRLAKDKGVNITKDLIGFSIEEADICDIEVDCTAKKITLPENIEFEKLAVYQALAQCILGREIEEPQIEQFVLTSLMQVKFLACDRFQCTPTIPFFGSYKQYYIDELFDPGVPMTDYIEINAPQYDELDRSGLLFDHCQNANLSDLGSISYLHEHLIEAIPYSDSLYYQSGNDAFYMVYNEKCCDHLAGLILSPFSSFYTGKLHNDMGSVLSESFKITHYRTTDRFYLYINEELALAFELELGFHPASYSYTYLDEPFGENCHVQIGTKTF